jgi:thiosulfate reductase cytochrome b subunit
VDDSASAARHSALVRTTHWITALCFLALLVSGFEIVVSHPRFYWGESGNIWTQPIFKLPIPASRVMVPTGYKYVLPDQNGWSRSLHFQAAWVVVLTGFLYTIASLLTGHLRKDLIPGGAGLYNTLQRLTYLFVIFALFPLVIWTGLAMSPGFVSAIPATVTLLGGQQTARTIHFFVSLALLLFLVGHVVMVIISGFRSRMQAMITGRNRAHLEGT